MIQLLLIFYCFLEFFEQGKFARLLLQKVTTSLIEGKRVLKCADSAFSQAGTLRSDGGHSWEEQIMPWQLPVQSPTKRVVRLWS